MAEFKRTIEDVLSRLPTREFEEEPSDVESQYSQDRLELILDRLEDAKIAELPPEEREIAQEGRNRIIDRYGNMLDMNAQNRLNVIIEDTIRFLTQFPLSVRPLLRIFYNIVAPYAGLQLRGVNTNIRDREILANMMIEGQLPNRLTYGLGSRFIIGMLKAIGANTAKILSYNLIPILYNKLFPEKTGDTTKDAEAIELHPMMGFPFITGGEFNYNGPGTNVERRLKLLKPSEHTFPTGSKSYVFPINLQDAVAFEHDLFYATNDELIQQMADIRYINYLFRNTDTFINRLKSQGIKIPDDIKLNKYSHVSTFFIATQALSRATGGLASWVKRFMDRFIKLKIFSASGQLLKSERDILMQWPEILGALKLAINRDTETLADLIAKKFNADPSIVKAFLEGREDRINIPEYDKFISDVEKVSDKMYSMMGKYGSFDKSGNFNVDKMNLTEIEDDLTVLYKDFNVMSDEQYKVDGYRGYNRLPDAPAKEDLDNFNNRIEKLISNNIVSTKLLEDKMPIGVNSLLSEIREDDQNVKYDMVRRYKNELKSRNLPTLGDTELAKFKTPEEQYDELTKYAWKNAPKDSNTIAAIVDADDRVDMTIIDFLKPKISEEHMKRLESAKQSEKNRVERNMASLDSSKGKPEALFEGGKRMAAPKELEVEVSVTPSKTPSLPSKTGSVVPMPTPSIKGAIEEGYISQDDYKKYKESDRLRKSGVPLAKQPDDVRLARREVDKQFKQFKRDKQVEFSVKTTEELFPGAIKKGLKMAEPPSKALVASLTPADNVLTANTQSIKEQPKSKSAKTTSETSAEAKVELPIESPELFPGAIKKGMAAAKPPSKALVPTESKGAEAKSAETKVREAEAVPLPAPVTEESVVLPKPAKEPGPVSKEEIKRAMNVPEAVGIASIPEGKAPDNLVETAVNPIDRIVDKLMKQSANEIRQEMRALMAFITPPDQTGGLGTVKTNPLIRDNAKHHDAVVVGPGNLYKDTVKNHLLANTSNLAMLQQFDKTQVDATMTRIRDAPRNRLSLERVVPDVLTTQRQSKAESRDFINSINPSSAFAYGSSYDSYFQPVGRAGNYVDDRDLSTYWGNPSTSFTPVRYQNP